MSRTIIRDIPINIHALEAFSVDDLCILDRIAALQVGATFSKADVVRAHALVTQLLHEPEPAQATGERAQARPATSSRAADANHLFRGCGTTLVMLAREALQADGVTRAKRLAVEQKRDIPQGSPLRLLETTHFRVEYHEGYGDDAVAGANTPSSGVLQVFDPGASSPVLLGSVTTASNGHPEYVRRLAWWLEYATTKFAQFVMPLPPRPVSPPTNPPTWEKIPVVLEGGPFLQAVRGMVDPADFRMSIYCRLNLGLLPTLCSHEVFHLCQATRSHMFFGPGNNRWRSGMVEGGAVLAEDLVADHVNRYIFDANQPQGTLHQPFRDLTALEGRYEQALLWKYIVEQISHSDGYTSQGAAYKAFHDAVGPAGVSTDMIDGVVRAQLPHQTLHQIQYVDHLQPHDVFSDETLLGNFWLALYLANGGASSDARFLFLERQDSVHHDEILTTSDPVDITLFEEAQLPGLGSPTSTGVDGLLPVAVQDHPLTSAAALTLASHAPLSRFGAAYYRVAINPSVSSFQVRVDLHWQAISGAPLGDPPRPLLQLILLESVQGQPRVRDIVRSDQPSWRRIIANDQGGVLLTHAVLVIAATDEAIVYDARVEPVADAPDVRITRWCTPQGQSYPIAPAGGAWTFMSPDIWVDPGPTVWLEEDNTLRVRISNRGRVDAHQVRVELHYQDASTGIGRSWLPVRDRNGIVQVVTGLSVPAGADHTASVSWAPPAGPTPPTALAVRALIVATGDLNVDDKRAMTLLSDVAERVLRMAADDGEARGDLDLRVTRAVVEDQPPERLVVSLHHTGWEVSPSDLARANTRAPTPEEERTGRMWDVLRFRPRAAGGTPAASTTRAPEFVALRTRQTTLPQSLRGAPLATIERRAPSGALAGTLTVVLPRARGT